jgi:hypothetical protein
MAEKSNIDYSLPLTGNDILQALSERVANCIVTADRNANLSPDQQTECDSEVLIPVNDGMFAFNCLRDSITHPHDPRRITSRVVLSGLYYVSGQSPQDAILNFEANHLPFGNQYTLTSLPEAA